MKAISLHGARDVRAADHAQPGPPGAGEVLVRMHAVGLCGTDRHWYLDGHIGPTALHEPFVLGHEAAGEVVAVGDGVQGLAPGDKVALDPALSCLRCEFCLEGNPNVCPQGRFCGNPGVPGFLQEYLLHPAQFAFRLPPAFSYTQGAQLEPLGVAVHAVGLGKLRLADTVAVLGTGPIGLFVVQLALRSGAVRVFAADPLPARRAAALAAGAEVALDPRGRDPVAAVLELTGGRGVDVAFEVAGELETPRQSVEMCKPTGTVVVTGICADDAIPLPHGASRKRGITVKVSRRMKHTYARAIALVEHGMVDVESMISHRYPLEEALRAFADAAVYRDGLLKAIVEW
jgi:L-iditol 2-dehydrogenase